MDIINGIYSGDQRSISKAISLVEKENKSSIELIKSIYNRTGNSFIIGVTGPPGVGKSTLINNLITKFSKTDDVGVLLIDPTSNLSGGAFLGDRVRIVNEFDNNVFIRSIATRGNQTGLSNCVRNAIRILEASGKKIIIIETVGIGQKDVDLINVFDCTLLVLMPNLGDEIQLIKAGIMEYADFIIVNKFDLSGADSFINNLRIYLSDKDSKKIIIDTIATKRKNLDLLFTSIQSYKLTFSISDDYLMKKIEYELKEKLCSNYNKKIEYCLNNDDRIKEIIEMVKNKSLDPDSASNTIFKLI